MTTITDTISAELLHMFQSLQKCLDLRDKYISKSRQRLGDNPRDYDGEFAGLDDNCAGVSGIRPDANFAANRPSSQKPERWTIYPPPPPPHWHWTDQQELVSSEDHRSTEFDINECHIPGDDTRIFAIDDTGVFQVYEDAAKSVFHIFWLHL